MQALGSYRGKRMLFLGLGTGLGSALIVNGGLEPLELAHLAYRKGRTFEDLNAAERSPSLRKAVLNVTAGMDDKREILDTGLRASPARVAWPLAWIGFSVVSEVKVPA